MNVATANGAKGVSVHWLVPPRIRWKLPDLLKQERVTANELAVTINEQLGTKLARNAVYRIAKDPKRPDLETMAVVIAALERITGKRFEIADLMEYDRDGEA